jgi:hypothetical protein
MKKNFPNLNLTLELADDIIMVRETSTTELLKAKTFPVGEVMEQWRRLVNIYTERELARG